MFAIRDYKGVDQLYYFSSIYSDERAISVFVFSLKRVEIS